MRVLSVVGARPQFVKLAPIAHAMTDAGIDHVIVHTGQHYDHNMSDVFFADLRIPDPDVHLGVGSGSHGVQTGAMLAAMDAVLAEHVPDWVLVYGDTNSTLAGALCAVKQHIPTAHLEAGLRSFNRRMPEEHNRILTDHACDLLLAPTETARDHLRREGLEQRTVVVGDVMADVCLRVAAQEADVTASVPMKPGAYHVATMHRAENTDDPDRLKTLIGALAQLDEPVVLMAHPRLRERASAAGISLDDGEVHVVDPLPYPQMINAVMRSRSVITDSGGLQKEAYILGVPCTTLRAETEWTETLTLGWNMLCPDGEDLSLCVNRDRPAQRPTFYGAGDAAVRSVQAILNAG